MNRKDTYSTIRTEVLEVIDETPLIKTVSLKPETPLLFETGQFIQFTVYGEGEAPFTPSSSPLVKERFDVTVMKAGRVTERIHRLKPGDKIGVRGPLGKGYPLEDFYDKEVLILGGGVGLAPLRSLLLKLLSEKEKKDGKGKSKK